MTTDSEKIDRAVDEITQDQQSLDAEQEAEPTPQYLTSDQVQEIIGRQTQTILSQVQGLQGKIDNGLDAVRRDTQAWAQQQMGDLQSEMSRERYLSEMDPEQAAFANNYIKPALDKLERRLDAVGQPPQGQPPQGQPQQAHANDYWQQVYGVVSAFGVEPNDPSVDYSTLQRGDQQAFIDSITRARDARVISTYQASQGAPSPSPTTQRSPSPPIEGGGRSSSLVTEEDIMDAYITDRFNSSEDPNGSKEYKRRMAEVKSKKSV